MAETYIIYNGTLPGRKKVAQAITDLRAAANTLADIKPMMDAIADGGLTKANLETGHPSGALMFGVELGQGAAFYDAVVAVKAGIDAIAATTWRNLYQGD